MESTPPHPHWTERIQRRTRRAIARTRRVVAKKRRQTTRLSRTGVHQAVFIIGAAGVAGLSMVFSWMADRALEYGRHVSQYNLWLALLILPPGLAGLRWLTLRLAPQARGSGIPQVIAGLSLPPFDPAQSLLVSPSQALWKIVLTTAALFIGASVGREGPSVQVGAAAMLAWGYVCRRHLNLRHGFRAEALLTAGAAGGLAAAFNTPLAGVVFAIEELTKGMTVRWDRQVLSAVLVCGFLSLAVVGNNPYFHVTREIVFNGSQWGWVLASAVTCGMLGGVFSRLLLGGLPRLLPRRLKQWPILHPVTAAFGCGVVLALIGLATHAATFGTGYDQAAAILNGAPPTSDVFGIAKYTATVFSYFAGIPGGIFTPSLAIGAGIGQHLSSLAGVAADPRMLALVSMAAFLAAATQAPITASVIVMEMTRSQQMTFFLLAATLVASFVSRQFSPHPFYHAAARNFRREATAAVAPKLPPQDIPESRADSGPEQPAGFDVPAAPDQHGPHTAARSEVTEGRPLGPDQAP